MNVFMMNLLYSLVFFNIFILFVKAQRVAPGVPPQHYQHQQQAPPPQYQQVPQHQQQQYGQPHQQIPVQQQVPSQQQQVPVQRQQYHVPQQQVPVPVQDYQVPIQEQVPIQQQQQQQHQQPQGHNHGHGHGRPQQILNAANVAQEAQHIAEHMDVPMDTSKMTEQELQFHYFKMHDADNNNKLDGCELIKSLIHWHEQGSKDKQGTVEEKVFKDEELVNLIDPILNVDDANRDGYIDYPEFIRAQQKAAGQAKPQA